MFIDLLEKYTNVTSLIKIDDNHHWNKHSKKLFLNYKELKLSYNEIAILDLLIQNQNKIFSSYDIFNIISASNLDGEFTENTIKSAIKRLRKKLPENTITNIYGQGYSISLK